MDSTLADAYFMRRALELAERGRGRVEPNPMVGCVIVRDGVIVGEGWHERFGGPHAEVKALAAAGENARGATLYVTLEPCSATGKKTPPCTEAILRAGIAAVVIGALDPTQSGAAFLRGKGVVVRSGVLSDECRDLIRPFLKLTLRGLPYVIAKWAMSLDGKIATSTGDSRWISGEASRALVHRWRSEVDAVVVGIGTVLRDDPLLTARLPGARNPIRIILDTHARLPLNSQLVRTAHQAPLWICAVQDVPGDRVGALTAAGCTVLSVPRDGEGVNLRALFAELGGRRITNVMIEGGTRVLRAAFAAGLVDEVRVFIAPVLIGAGGYVVDAGAGTAEVKAALRLRKPREEKVGDDVLVVGYVTGDAAVNE